MSVVLKFQYDIKNFTIMLHEEALASLIPKMSDL